MPPTDWNTRFDYLRRSHRLGLNDDYLAFLVDRVWRLDRPCAVVDFGCGFGYWAGQLLPLLPPGSSYTGIDTAGELLAEGRRLFAGAPFPARFFCADAYDAPFAADQFDIAITRALLMHLTKPAQALREMIRLVRPSGRVIALEPNWDAYHALIHVDEMDKLQTHDLGFLQTLFERGRRADGTDGNIGRKLPALMHRLGLKDVGCRLNDCAPALLPPIAAPDQEALYAAINNDGWDRPVGATEAEEKQRRFASLGFTQAQARAQIQRERRFTTAFRAHGRRYHSVCPIAMMFSYGTVAAPNQRASA